MTGVKQPTLTSYKLGIWQLLVPARAITLTNLIQSFQKASAGKLLPFVIIADLLRCLRSKGVV